MRGVDPLRSQDLCALSQRCSVRSPGHDSDIGQPHQVPHCTKPGVGGGPRSRLPGSQAKSGRSAGNRRAAGNQGGCHRMSRKARARRNRRQRGLPPDGSGRPAGGLTLVTGSDRRVRSGFPPRASRHRVGDRRWHRPGSCCRRTRRKRRPPHRHRSQTDQHSGARSTRRASHGTPQLRPDPRCGVFYHPRSGGHQRPRTLPRHVRDHGHNERRRIDDRSGGECR